MASGSKRTDAAAILADVASARSSAVSAAALARASFKDAGVERTVRSTYATNAVATESTALHSEFVTYDPREVWKPARTLRAVTAPAPAYAISANTFCANAHVSGAIPRKNAVTALQLTPSS